MNKDQVKGAVNEAAGKLQKNVGKAVGSPGNQVEGAVREVAGKAQKAYGNAREDAEDRKRSNH
jgi:uncharacterized protein YjbJ (UPF0337 family)